MAHTGTRNWAVGMLDVLDLKRQPPEVSRQLDTRFRHGDRLLELIGIYAVIEGLSIKELTWKEEEAWNGALRNFKSEWLGWGEWGCAKEQRQGGQRRRSRTLVPRGGPQQAG